MTVRIAIYENEMPRKDVAAAHSGNVVYASTSFDNQHTAEDWMRENVDPGGPAIVATFKDGGAAFWIVGHAPTLLEDITLTPAQIMPLVERMLQQYNIDGGKPNILLVHEFNRLQSFLGYNIYLELRGVDRQRAKIEQLVEAICVNNSGYEGFIAPLEIGGQHFQVGDGDDSLAANYDEGAMVLRFWLRAWDNGGLD